ncbi:Aminomethyltransferase folate-binding domain-containing protein [Russula earlei]|uniref:Aminomethyltransferase folate-binding domain-containing protein n=1 Tax=Russula earlei TaxID=71964 RepID=A0ACC0UFP6_9AGAM|nr:Aminomethyltransferase folate-binding domain-containing protein [Russula earlei]
MPTPASVLALVRAIPTTVRLHNRALVSVSGSQAAEFLNGLISTAVTTPPHRSFYSSFLHAQGRVIYDVFVHATRDSQSQPAYLIEYDATATADAPALFPLLKRHVLRSKVRVTDVSDEFDVWAAWDNDVATSDPKRWTRKQGGIIEPAWDAWPWGSEGEALMDRRADGMGVRRVVRKGDRPLEASTHDEGVPDDYLLHRIIHGVPEGVDDIPPLKAFPMESNLDVMGALDFRKGCYVGQELTVRTYHTGVIRKRILPVLLHPPPNPTSHRLGDGQHEPNITSGRDIRASLTRAPGEGRVARPRGTGKLLSTVKNVGLALLRLEHVDGLERGDLRFELVDGEASVSDNGDSTSWLVTPWWPDWWPKVEVGS